MKFFLLKIISFYQKEISPRRPLVCKFFPSCSEYAKEAIIKYGSVKGSRMALSRILRCHPWQKKFFDPLS